MRRLVCPVPLPPGTPRALLSASLLAQSSVVFSRTACGVLLMVQDRLLALQHTRLLKINAVRCVQPCVSLQLALLSAFVVECVAYNILLATIFMLAML